MLAFPLVMVLMPRLQRFFQRFVAAEPSAPASRVAR
jgi:hypothetical protein